MNQKVHERFSRISAKYDFMNHFLSMGVDKKWRTEAAKEAMLPKKNYRVLDLATGTGDLAIAIKELSKKRGKEVRILGTDFNSEMLRFAKEKATNRDIKVGFEIDDATHMKYKDGSFDVITAAFLLRSLTDLNKFLSEVRRVLKKGGKFVLLDMARPDTKEQRRFFHIYSYFIRFLALFSDREAYNWLVDSINKFDKKDLLRKLKAKGFRNVRMRSLSSGIAYLVTGEK